MRLDMARIKHLRVRQKMEIKCYKSQIGIGIFSTWLYSFSHVFCLYNFMQLSTYIMAFPLWLASFVWGLLFALNSGGRLVPPAANQVFLHLAIFIFTRIFSVLISGSGLLRPVLCGRHPDVLCVGTRVCPELPGGRLVHTAADQVFLHLAAYVCLGVESLGKGWPGPAVSVLWQCLLHDCWNFELQHLWTSGQACHCSDIITFKYTFVINNNGYIFNSIQFRLLWRLISIS